MRHPWVNLRAPLLVGGLLSIVVFVAGCNGKVDGGKDQGAGSPPAAESTPPRESTLKGVALSPKSFEPADFTDFFERAAQAGKVVAWAGDWNELGGAKGGPRVVTELARTRGYVPVIEAQFFHQDGGRLLRPLDEATKRSYKDSAVAFAKEYHPEYLAFGIEVNMLYEQSPAEFDRFVVFYDELYDAVKAVSSDTRVFTTFQLEKMKGLSGGLFGGTNDPDKAQWRLLERFPKADLIAFTTYPGLIYKDPADMPADYYDEIAKHTSKPVAFTEIGWHSEASPRGWESSESEQAGFIGRFFGLTGSLKKEMAIWSFMYDQKTIEPFRSMGLRRKDGTARPAWDSWLNAD